MTVRDHILNTLAASGTTALSQTDIVSRTGCVPSSVRRTMQQLTRQGDVVIADYNRAGLPEFVLPTAIVDPTALTAAQQRSSTHYAA